MTWTEKYYVGTYWGIRRESAVDCARRAFAFFRCLSQCDPVFTNWFPIRKQVGGEIDTSIDIQDEKALEQLFLEGRHYTDIGHEAMEDLGFRLTLWNTKRSLVSPGEFSISITCGSYAEQPGVNLCLINLPAKGDVLSRILRVEVLGKIMQCMVLFWQPSWGVVTSNTHLRIAPKRNIKAPLVGWLTYLSKDRGEVPSLPPSIIVTSIGDEGSLITVTQDKFSANNPEQIEIANHLETALEESGLLTPLK